MAITVGYSQYPGGGQRPSFQRLKKVGLRQQGGDVPACRDGPLEARVGGREITDVPVHNRRGFIGDLLEGDAYLAVANGSLASERPNQCLP
jgi:hypothetical protein